MVCFSPVRFDVLLTFRALALRRSRQVYCILLLILFYDLVRIIVVQY